MNPIKAIIIEDEKEGMENIVIKINRECPDVKIIEKCTNGLSAIKAIEKLNPDLLFLDIQLGNMSGFDVLSKLSHIHFEVIFTTAYSQYAIDAIKVSAIDYLLKPIKPKELRTAVDKARIRIQELGAISRIAVPISNGYQFIPVNDILYCLADDNCTNIIRQKDQKKVYVTKPLKHILVKLPTQNFLRISRSAVVNLDHVDNFRRSSGGVVTMGNGDELSVTREKREELLNRMNR